MSRLMMQLAIGCSVVLLLVAAFGCGGCEDTSEGQAHQDDAGTDLPDADDDTDGDGLDAEVPDADDPDADTDPDADDNGADDDCPLAYQQECDGECISTNTDIDNCGDCGESCEGEQACVGGECTTECMGNLQLCDNACVDYSLDADHCGSCGNECADGEGCSDGECVPTADLDPGPDECDDSGPPIEVDTDDDFDACAGDLAQGTFLWALCTCEDLVTEDEFLTDGFDSTSGPYQPGGLGAGVGVNGNLFVESEMEIWGPTYVGEPSGAFIEDETEIHQQFRIGGDLDSSDTCEVHDDTHIAGDIDASGDLDIAGDLYSPPGADRTGTINYADLIEQPVSVPPPCGCNSESVIPIDDIVSSAQSPDNDNALIGLDEDAFSGSDAEEHMILPCGEYYLSEITADSDVTIIAEGRVVLYVDGDIDPGGELTLLPGPEGELDIFIDGDVDGNDGLTLGSPNYPASTRMYIGGDDGMTLSDETQIAGNIYAVPGKLLIEDSIDVFGALYAQEAAFESELSIHYDRQVTRSGEDCPDDDDDDDNGDDNGNGDDDVCALEDETCDDDEDCCAPLLCDDTTGTCRLMECQPSGEPCVANDECCSLTCALDSDGDGTCVAG